MKNLLKALAQFQDEVPTIHEETQGYNYTYSNLTTIFKVIKPLMKKHGLGFFQSLDMRNLHTTIFHVESGELITSSSAIPEVNLKGMNDYQTLGSGITYLRRYSLSVMLGLITDKDVDACGEQEPKKKAITDKIIKAAVEKQTTIDVLKKYYIIDEIQEELITKMLKDGTTT